MSACRYYISFLAAVTLLFACREEPKGKMESVFTQVPEIRDVRIEKRVKIKLRRSSKDGYTWEIQGDDASDILTADKKLRKGLKLD